MNTESIQNDIVDDFNVLEDDFEMTLNYLMEIGEQLEAYNEENRLDENLIKGCQSKVWLSYKIKDNNKIFIQLFIKIIEIFVLSNLFFNNIFMINY